MSENVLIGSTRWHDGEGSRHERYQVVSVRDGEIIDMQGFGFKSRRQASARPEPGGVHAPEPCERHAART